MSNYLSTTMIAKKHGINSKDLIEYLIKQNYIYRENKDLKLSQKGKALDAKYRSKDGGTWIVWKEDSLDNIINRSSKPVKLTYSEVFNNDTNNILKQIINL